jgi:hypothetical protein
LKRIKGKWKEKRKQRQIDAANKKALIDERKRHRVCMKQQKEEKKNPQQSAKEKKDR